MNMPSYLEKLGYEHSGCYIIQYSIWQVKEVLHSAHFDPDNDIVLYCDASPYGVWGSFKVHGHSRKTRVSVAKLRQSAMFCGNPTLLISLRTQ